MINQGFRFSLLILLRLRIKLFDSLYKYLENMLQADRKLALYLTQKNTGLLLTAVKLLFNPQYANAVQIKAWHVSDEDSASLIMKQVWPWGQS